jgi:hypothetical protein
MLNIELGKLDEPLKMIGEAEMKLIIPQNTLNEE